jgi:hypothetical protein
MARRTPKLWEWKTLVGGVAWPVRRIGEVCGASRLDSLQAPLQIRFEHQARVQHLHIEAGENKEVVRQQVSFSGFT